MAIVIIRKNKAVLDAEICPWNKVDGHSLLSKRIEFNLNPNCFDMGNTSFILSAGRSRNVGTKRLEAARKGAEQREVKSCQNESPIPLPVPTQGDEEN